jgi:4-diphosphocytidyl-2-C-methyl-D-erythritol kinase
VTGPRAASGEGAGRPTVTVTAPAKLTLSLRVTGVRPDGYHLLESEMVTVDLADTLVIEEGDGRGSDGRGGGGLSIEADPDGPWSDRASGPIPLGAENLVTRALVAVGRSAAVHVVKRVPPGAGLGGGSADAAAILRWAGCTDIGVAASLGADVPFCVTGGRAMVGGVGEVVSPLPYQARWFTLLLVPFGVDTAAVYRAWDRLADPGGPSSGGARVAPEASEGPSNDLEAAALIVEPRLGHWRDHLEGLTGRRPSLAGSGSTWFVGGSAEELGLVSGQSVQIGEETAVLVSVRTTPPMA